MSKKKTSKKKPVRATKKKVVKKQVTIRKKRPAALSEERTHKLTKTQLMKWRMLFAEAQQGRAELTTRKLEHEKVLGLFHQAVMENPTFAKLFKMVQQAENSVKATVIDAKGRIKEHDEYVQSVALKVGLNSSHGIAIDEQTGIVREISPNSGQGATPDK
jgi:hypothetical protein